MTDQTTKTAMDHAADLKSEGMQCNCDLDRWEPEPLTGHSHVCRIHKAAIERRRGCKL
jgi:hypothetical protein